MTRRERVIIGFLLVFYGVLGFNFVVYLVTR